MGMHLGHRRRHVVGLQSSCKDYTLLRMNGDEATVKRLVRKPGLIHLAPANPKYRPIPIDENTSIIGKVVRVVRQYV